jgi:hypothetical protein
MTFNVAEVIRSWLGWCPDRMMAPRSLPFRESNPVSSVLFGDRGPAMQEVIVDYGSTGISIPLFTLILAGTITGLFAFMRYGLFESWSVPGLTLLILFILGIALRMLHQDIKKAMVEFTRDALVIRRPLFRPVIIAKDAITTIGVQKNINHSHRWLFRGAALIFLAGIIPAILSSGYFPYLSRVISRISFTLFVVYQLAVVLFFGLVFYHGYIRSRYPDVVTICTSNKKIVGLFVDDPGKMSDMLATWEGI